MQRQSTQRVGRPDDAEGGRPDEQRGRHDDAEGGGGSGLDRSIGPKPGVQMTEKISSLLGDCQCVCVGRQSESVCNGERVG